MDSFYLKSNKLRFGSNSKIIIGDKSYQQWYSAYGKLWIPSSSKQHCRWDLRCDLFQ